MAIPRQLAGPAYLVAFALLFIPPLDAVMQVLPLRLGDPRWRWGTFGLLSNAMMIPMTGLLIALVATSLFEHVRLKRVLGVLALLVALGALGAFAIFGLDALQVRQDVQPEARLPFTVGTGTAALKALLGIATFGWFGIAAFKGPKPAKAGKSSKSGGLILGSRGTTTPASSAAATPTVNP